MQLVTPFGGVPFTVKSVKELLQHGGKLNELVGRKFVVELELEKEDKK